MLKVGRLGFLARQILILGLQGDYFELGLKTTVVQTRLT